MMDPRPVKAGFHLIWRNEVLSEDACYSNWLYLSGRHGPRSITLDVDPYQGSNSADSSSALNFWGDRNGALMCALAMTATAVSLTMVSLRSEGLHKTRAATGIMTYPVLVPLSIRWWKPHFLKSVAAQPQAGSGVSLRS